MPLAAIAAAVAAADWDGVERALREALEAGISKDEVMGNGLGRGLQVCLQAYLADESSMSDVLASVDTVGRALDTIREDRSSGDRIGGRHTAVLGLIEGSSQDLGKNVIKMLFICNGIDVVDVGKNVPPEQFIQAAWANDAELVAVSAMTSISVPRCERLMSLWAESGLADKAKVIVGGTAVSADLATALHFDGYAENALGALELALALMKKV